MRLWVPTALILAIAAALPLGAADARSCTSKSHRNCLTMPAAINFSSVSDISKQIVSEEPAAAKPTTRTLEAPPITTYTGPTLEVNSMARAPTVGYYWSLEPEADNH